MQNNLFITGFVQVFLVAMNTYFLSKEIYLAVMASSFMISFIWSYNVQKIAFGSNRDRITYAFGACLGSVSGLYFSSVVSTLSFLK